MAMCFRATTVPLKRASLPTQWSPAFISHVAHNALLYYSRNREISAGHHCVCRTQCSHGRHKQWSPAFISHVAHTHAHECNSKHKHKLTPTPIPPTPLSPALLLPPPLLTAHTQVWAKELAKHQIRVGAIAPGVVHTKILDSVRMTSRKDTNTLCRERERRHTETDT